jgi:5-methylcytosine-specific restriction endonuclease McrA
MKRNGKRNGSTRAWRALRAKVLAEEPICRIQGPGCTHIATTVDHIEPYSLRPDLALVRSNCRGACARCNYARGDGTNQQTRAPRPAALAWFDTGRSDHDGPPASLGA